MSAVTARVSNDLRNRIVAVLREDRDVRNIGALADQLEAAIRAADPIAYLRHGEEAFVQNVPFGAMWISDKDDPRAFPVYDCPQHPAPSVAVQALEWTPWPGNDQTKNGQSGRRIMRRADGAGMAYSLERVEPQSEWFYVPPGQVAGDWYVMKFWNEVAGPFKTDLEALEWCKRDHETRIRSALSAQVQDVAEREPKEIATWEDQQAFEAWAQGERYETHQHPLHYLFMDPKTNAARQGWKAALQFIRDRSAAAPAKQEGK